MRKNKIKNKNKDSNTDWKLGEKERIGIRKVAEKAIIVGVIPKDQTEDQVLEYLDELEFLAETAGAITVKRFTQKLGQPDRRTFVGKGETRRNCPIYREACRYHPGYF